MNTPKRIDLKPEQIEALLERVKSGSLQEGDYEIIKAMSETIEFLSQMTKPLKPFQREYLTPLGVPETTYTVP